MKPIGLVFKHITYNPFTDKTSGELMIVHLCLNCDKISTNRIAGDDNAQSIIQLLDEPKSLDPTLIHRLHCSNLTPLTRQDEQQVLACLFGY